MVAPPVAVQLRIKGFHEQVLHPHVPLCKPNISVQGLTDLQYKACQRYEVVLM